MIKLKESPSISSEEATNKIALVEKMSKSYLGILSGQDLAEQFIKANVLSNEL